MVHQRVVLISGASSGVGQSTARWLAHRGYTVFGTSRWVAADGTSKRWRAVQDAYTRRQPGKDIYLMGGARIVATLIDAGLVDELRLIVHPLIASGGKALFEATERRRPLELRKLQELTNGRVSLIYGIG